MPLTNLNENQCGIIKNIQKLPTMLQKRFADFGIYEGAKITLLRKLPFRGPLLFQVEDSQISVRFSDAKHIVIDHA